MTHKILGPLLWPVIMGIYHLLRRDYHYAYGMFAGAVLLLPVLHWLQGMTLPPNTLYIALGVFIVLTALELWYIRSKRKGRGLEH